LLLKNNINIYIFIDCCYIIKLFFHEINKKKKLKEKQKSDFETLEIMEIQLKELEKEYSKLEQEAKELNELEKE